MNESQGNKIAYVAGAATTLIKTGRGHLHSVTIGLPSASTVSVYDGLSAAGTLIAVLTAAAVPFIWTPNCTFGVGLTVVTAGTSNISVVYQ